ncbi:MAG TPA: sigma 54-interacting transcriptional regulator [Limnobacter sp.]|uniref:sigma-54-dependent Fis family transcriptional regulator n=1 Tax=Limnobacter sp. TaxID=2003368 RepID=UPI002E374A39|nr:sigma 54-interacting transcriptional regulator [Limnobacter sp.]HEX5486013.1 sigma 54-interacting transcriptional regulator [Limnobacter sp.]
MSFLPDQGNAVGTPNSKVIELIDPNTEGHLEFIRRAHKRCAESGLESSSKVNFEPAARDVLQELVAKNNQLRSCALPFMETLYEQVVSTHSMVLLTDASGTIIESLGDDDFLEKAQKVALAKGMTWSEESKGTNAIGTALIEELPTVVHGQDHFLDVNRFLTCSAAPIFDPTGVPLGVLDVTGDYRTYHRHTMGLVRMSAQMIENHLFNSSFQDSIIVQFHQRGEFLGSVVEGAAAFTPSGKFLAANRAAMVQFGMSVNALRTHTFSSLFGMPISALIDHYRTCNPEPLILCLHNGNHVTARASLGSVGRSQFFGSAGLARSNDILQGNMVGGHAGRTPAEQSQQALNKNRYLSSLKYLNTGDPTVAKVIDKLGKVIGKDIPILILGETGTGKEILAQAIHNDSPRRDKPFVAVNCASIPETLIESELFGYEDGAFTGAKKKGSQGKILQANGGTLFLDEIGDMPISLQARLLRVLQERVVTPLGSQKSIPVNLIVICATHRNLRDLIDAGQFREDLYYRLHGLAVKLPALRDRKDIKRIIACILENESPNMPMDLAPDVANAFVAHSWPGNIRQLTNILRTAVVMADGNPTIEWEHLPDDFHDEWISLRSKRTKPTAAMESPLEHPQDDALHEPHLSGHTEPARHSASTGHTPQSRRPMFSVKPCLAGHPAPQKQAAQPVQRFQFQTTRHFQGAQAEPLRQHAAEEPFFNPQPAGTSSRSDLDQTFSRFREERFNNRFGGESSPYDQKAMEARSQGYLGAKAMQVSSVMDLGNLDDIETRAIQDALEKCHGNVSAAARLLGISRNTIYRRLKEKQQA